MEPENLLSLTVLPSIWAICLTFFGSRNYWVAFNP